MYFPTQEALNDYFGGPDKIPSNVLAIVGEPTEYVLYTVSNNQSMSGTMQEQGGYVTDWGEVEDLGYIIPAGSLSITENGEGIDVASYASVDVDVETGIQPTGTYEIIDNGMYDITSYASASVSVPASAVTSGTKSITENGVADVTSYKNVDVNVPIPAGYIVPAGDYMSTIDEWETVIDGENPSEMTVNLTSPNISEYETVTIGLQGQLPENASYVYQNGLVEVNPLENGQYNSYVYVDVPVPAGYIIPSGEIEIEENGEYDVSSYAYAYVNAGVAWEDIDYDFDVEDLVADGYYKEQWKTLEIPYYKPSDDTVIELTDNVPDSRLNTYSITQNGRYLLNPLTDGTGSYTGHFREFVDVQVDGGLPTYEFSGAYNYVNNFSGMIGKRYQLKDENENLIANVFTEDWWTYAFPTSGEMIIDPVFNDPTHKIYVMNDDVKNACTWQTIDYDYANLPEWNEAHLAKESYDYYKGVVTFIPEYNQESLEVLPYGMNRRYNIFSYVGLCSYGTGWGTGNTLYNKGAYMPLKKDSNVINNTNKSYWLTSQKLTYSGNANIWDGSYISSFFGSSWNAIIDNDGYIRDIVSKVGDTNTYQAKWGSDDTVTTTSTAISISGYITNQNYSDYVNNNNKLYINFDNINSYVSNQPYLFKYGFEPEFSSDINTSGITTYSTSKQVVLSNNSSVYDGSFDDIVNNYSEFTFDYTLTIPKRFFMDPENNPATLYYTFTGGSTPTGSDDVTDFQTAVGTSWNTENRVTGEGSGGSWVTSTIYEDVATATLENYKIFEINVTGATSGTHYFVPAFDSPDSLDINNLSVSIDVPLVEREDQNGRQMFTLDTTDLPANANLEVQISVPNGVLDPDDSYYMQCHVDYTITTNAGADTINNAQTQISQQWYTPDRKNARHDNGYFVTSISKTKTGPYMSGYKVNEVNITGATSGQLNLIPVIDNVMYFDDSISTVTRTFNLTDRTDENGVTFINADDVTTTTTWTLEIKIPDDALDPESANYKTCIITVTKS